MKNSFNNYLIPVIFISLIVLVIELWRLIPGGVDSFKVFGLQITSGEYQDFTVLVWVVSTKLAIIMLCGFWFLSSKYWWRFVIGVPLTIELFKLMEALDFNLRRLDESNYIDSLPFTVILLGLLIVVFWREYHQKKYHLLSVKLDNEINKCIKSQGNEEWLGEYNMQFNDLKKRRKQLSKEEYLKALKELQQHVEASL